MTDAKIIALLARIASVSDPVQARRSLDAFHAEAGKWLEDFAPLIDVLRDQLDQIRHLQQLAGTDVLTGVANRRAFFEAVDRQVALFQRRDVTFSVILLDLDDLKLINDAHGHAVGDEAIVTVARAAAATIRSTDLAARLGGDEFAVLLPDADESMANVAASRLRDAVEAQQVAGVRLKVSVGAATVDTSHSCSTSLMDLADRRLYSDKKWRKSEPPPSEEIRWLAPDQDARFDSTQGDQVAL